MLCAQGKFVYPDGDVYEGQWVNNKAHGEGARWSRSHRAAVRTHDGKEDGAVSLREAGRISEQVGLPCPGGWAGQ